MVILKKLVPAALVATLSVCGCGGGSGGSPDAGTDADTDADTDACEDGATETDEIGLTWVTICGGTFEMGLNSGKHEVTVPTFEILQTEVTVAQYGACVAAKACQQPGGGPEENWYSPETENHPVNYVEWYHARDFCAWAGGRLPSEAEWEYAARSGGRDIPFPWGDHDPTCDYAVMNYLNGSGCGTGRTWAVCSKTAGNTDQGLCDMAGNVSEWVQDCYHPDYTGAPADGSAWEEQVGPDRALRGGSFYEPAGSQWVDLRRADIPGASGPNLGFRCARGDGSGGDTDTDSALESSLTECAGGKLDPETNLCWQDPPMAVACDELDLGGHTDWRLPSIEELITLIRGCVDGTATGDLSRSSCTMTPAGCVATDSCTGVSNCDTCPEWFGPASGCYRDPGLSGSCWDYTSSSPSSNLPWCVWFCSADVREGYFGPGGPDVRCVRSGS